MAFVTEAPTWEDGVYQLETTDPVEGGPNGVDNLPHKHLANRTQYLKTLIDASAAEILAARQTHDSLDLRLDGMDGQMAALQSALAVLIGTNDPRTAVALRMDWLYANDRTAMELWGGLFSMLDVGRIGVSNLPDPSHPGVEGDDSLDIADTSGIKVGEWYALFDGTRIEAVRVSAVLAGSRIRLAGPLQHTYTSPAYLARTSLTISAANPLATASGRGGDLYFSRRVNLGNNPEMGGVWVRRTDNDTGLKLYYRDSTTTNWTESVSTVARRDDYVPIGLVDVQFDVPFVGDTWIKLELVPGTTTNNVAISHIACYGTRTGGSGSVTPGNNDALAYSIALS